MATLAPVNLTSTTQRLSASLTSGKSYVIQNIGSQDAQYCNFPTDPSTDSTGANVAWRICEPLEFFNSGRVNDTSNPLWVKARFGDTQLSVGEAP